ncbi:hypothetical protein SAMN02745126_05372 [Enhydrobacter aerosaccus]|uniref:SH3 domain-containing protein n=1 Tax=Enhydrobacter aerosaccus TaxID=225324 RepID=A0A1T4SZF3_9HYPH|nr:hypothetical protein [Enhydrobacter aerosaccus]SKA33613.1 hypothetical protein SAMN02745126_05372 [Enhydrobacter aerosaccus]
MIRAIIGTVAVLAGFAVVETSSDASTSDAGGGPRASCKATQAYAVLQPGEPVAVRAEPTPSGAVVGSLAAHRSGEGPVFSVVTLTGSQGGWARIALGSKDYSATDGATRSYGWIPADQLAVDTRLAGKVTLYDRPDLLGHAVASLENADQKFRVLGCRGEFLQVINAEQGNVWIDRWCARREGCRG